MADQAGQNASRPEILIETGIALVCSAIQGKGCSLFLKAQTEEYGLQMILG
jgi:hypothetical protein